MILTEIPLTAIPNQKFNIAIGNNVCEFQIRCLQGQAGFVLDITIDGTEIIRGLRPKAGVNFLRDIQYRLADYDLRAIFFVVSNDKTEMDWQDFGTTIRMYYGIRSES